MGKPNPGPPPREHLVQRRGFACVPTAMGFSCCNPKQLKLRFLYIGATRNLSFRKAKDFLGMLAIGHDKAAPRRSDAVPRQPQTGKNPHSRALQPQRPTVPPISPPPPQDTEEDRATTSYSSPSIGLSLRTGRARSQLKSAGPIRSRQKCWQHRWPGGRDVAAAP